MKRRFSVIQGGLSDGVAHASPAAAGAAWRVVLRRPVHVDASEAAAWRALNEATARADPFADPDFLLTAAQHAPHRDGGVLFALAYAGRPHGGDRLVGVLPLELPHPVWGGPTIRLWQPALAPHAVGPVFAAGAGPDVVEAVLRHLRSVRPRTELDLGEPVPGSAVAPLARTGDLAAIAVPRTQFVTLGGWDRGQRPERVTAPEDIRDAVERFLLADARHAGRPILSDPAAAATIRVVTRLLARRGLAEVELDWVDGEPSGGTIRLGAAGARVVWRETGKYGAEPRPGPTRDAPGARLRLVASRD